MRVVASREPSALLHLSRGDDSIAVPGVGARVAVAHLDQDGAAEVITTWQPEEESPSAAASGRVKPSARAKPSIDGTIYLAVMAP